MPMTEICSWPSPFDSAKLGVVILTEQSLYYSLRAGSVAIGLLSDEASDSEVEEALQGDYHSAARAEIGSLRLMPGGNRIRLVTERGRRAIEFGREQTARAEEVFRSLVGALELGPVREMNGTWRESIGNQLLVVLLVAIAGIYLGVLASLPVGDPREDVPTVFQAVARFARGIGPAGIWSAMSLGLVGAGGWLLHGLKHPKRVLFAAADEVKSAPATPEVDQEEVRVVMARLLELDPTQLRDETHFAEDLRIPPGVLLDALGELESELEIELASVKIRTYGDLRAAL